MAQNLRGALVGFCNPLLDISAVVDDNLLSEYKLKPNDAVKALPEHMPLFQTLIDKYDAKFHPGGSGQNTLRGAQLLLPTGAAVLFGAVGKDENAQRLQAAADKAGLRTNYMVYAEKPTGTCALLITGKNRSMVANLSAAEKYNVSHVKTSENWADIEAARFYYFPGFFLAISMETIDAVAKHAHETNKVFMLNLSAPFVPELLTAQVKKMLPFVNILFGNETEAAALAHALKLGTSDIKQIAKHVANLPCAGERPRMVVFTQGPESTVVAMGDSDEIRIYGVNEVSDAEFGDTNGAGDAFVAGFLSQYMQEKPVDMCIDAGHWLAGQVVRQVGPTYPDGKLNFVPLADFAPTIEKL
ncbi:adenosine kinase [Coemansia erecta]|nr:adenosine kinase [Coemansia sp. RSA 2618]KAJ2820006.1 adenosine kinase [Coemansia erecta]